MNDVELCSSVHVIALQDGFDLLTEKQQGFVAEYQWLAAMDYATCGALSVPEQGSEYDAMIIESGRRIDFKLFRGVHTNEYNSTAPVYLSHNEFLAGKEHDTLFVVFTPHFNGAKLTKIFSFSEAREAGAIQLYTEGTWVFSARTGKTEPPWSIDLFILDPGLRAIGLPDKPRKAKPRP